jgi:hypothetical protein
MKSIEISDASHFFQPEYTWSTQLLFTSEWSGARAERKDRTIEQASWHYFLNDILANPSKKVEKRFEFSMNGRALLLFLILGILF